MDGERTKLRSLSQATQDPDGDGLEWLHMEYFLDIFSYFHCSTKSQELVPFFLPH